MLTHCGEGLQEREKEEPVKVNAGVCSQTVACSQKRIAAAACEVKKKSTAMSSLLE